MVSKPKLISTIVITLTVTCAVCGLFSLISGPKLIMPGAERRTGTANILVFEDANGNGQQDANEGPLSDALIVVHSNIHGGFTRQTHLSDANGEATISLTYTHYFDVGVLPPCGYTATTPNSLSVVGASSFAMQRFGFQPQSKNPPTSINNLHFKLWFDINRDGQQQAAEPPLPDISLALIPPLDISYKRYGFDEDSLALTTNETGQATLDVGNFCGKIWLKQPKEWQTTMTTPASLQNDNQRGFSTQAGRTDIAWGLYLAKALITPVPIGHQFDFSFGGAYHPEGMGEWRVSLRSSGRFSVSHQIGNVTDSYGPVTLTRDENKAMWAAILAADIPGLPPTFQRLGIPDETAYTFSLYDGDSTHRVEMWADDAQQNESLSNLVIQLETLRKTYNFAPTPTVTPPPPNTPIPTATATSSPTPSPTATPLPPPDTPLILQYGWFGGDGGEILDGYFGRMTPNLALYADGRLLIRQGRSHYDHDLNFVETILSQAEMCALLAQIEATGYFNETDSIFTFERPFGAGQPSLQIQINGPRFKGISSEAERVGDFIPEIADTYEILQQYRPAEMTPYRPQQVVLWIEPDPPTVEATPIPWPGDLPPLSEATPVPENRQRPPAGRKLLTGEAAVKVADLFDNLLTGRYFTDNGQNYYVVARPLLPNESFDPDYLGMTYGYLPSDFTKLLPCGAATRNDAPPPCTLRQEFNLSNQPFDDLARLEFIDDSTLALAGWGSRPKPTATPTPNTPPTATPTPTPGPSPTPRPTAPPSYGDRITSPRHAYYRATLTLADGTIETGLPQLEPLTNPCAENPCTLELLDQSPDGRWQLLHIWANGRGAEGAWLVSQQEQIRLGEPFVPFDSFWQWAQDSSLLWYQRVGPGYGLTAETYVVRLDSLPVVQLAPVDWDHPLDSNGYRPAFSPIEKMIYTVRKFETDSDHFEWPATERYQFDVTHSLTQTTAQETVPNLAKIIWNEADGQFWQMFITEDGLILTPLKGERDLSIPLNFFEGYMESIASGNLSLIDLIPQSKLAIGPAGQQVTLNLRGQRVLWFGCAN